MRKIEKVCIWKILSYILQDIHRTQLKALVVLVYAFLKVQKPFLSSIARELPPSTSFKHRLKRVYRFMKESAISQDKVFNALAHWMRVSFSHLKSWEVLIDWTNFKDYRVLALSLVIKGRSIPVYWTGYHLSALPVSQNLIEEDAIRRFLSFFSKENRKRIILIGDRGFGRISLFKFLKKEGIGWMIRVKGDVMVKFKGYRGTVRGIGLKRGEIKWYEGVLYHQSGRMKVNLWMGWKGKEPWYLITNLKEPDNAGTIYARRMRIEESFRDFKWNLEMKKVRVEGLKRVMRFFLLAVLVYYLCVLEGLYGEQKEFWRKVTVKKKGKTELSIFNLGLLLFSDILFLRSFFQTLYKKDTIIKSLWQYAL